LTSAEIKKKLAGWGGYHGICIPEFTWGGLRIGAVIIDTAHRWVRGFEIKADRSDFLRDDKWTLYTKFCSSLSIVCPEGMIQPSEVEKPFGLVWAFDNRDKFDSSYLRWVKRAKNFQSRKSLSWLWTYVGILETGFSRMQYELNDLKIRSGLFEGGKAG
jgi:hypothetical protein